MASNPITRIAIIPPTLSDSAPVCAALSGVPSLWSGTDGRGGHPAPRMPRPHLDHRATPPRRGATRVRPALQRAPTSPIVASTPARRRHSPALRSNHPAAATKPARRPHTRVRAGRMTGFSAPTGNRTARGRKPLQRSSATPRPGPSCSLAATPPPGPNRDPQDPTTRPPRRPRPRISQVA
jgi:hypothetical protein